MHWRIWGALGVHVIRFSNFAAQTRASAQKATNTPSLHHFLFIKYFKVNNNDIWQNQWTMKYRSLTHIYFTMSVSAWVTLIYHPKYNFSGVNSLQDMKQICWIIKYRSLTSYTSEVIVCVEVLRPSQPNGVMSSAVSLPNHTFTGQA